MADLNVGLAQGIGRNLRLKQRLSHEKQYKKESDRCTVICWGCIDVTNNALVITRPSNRTGRKYTVGIAVTLS